MKKRPNWIGYADVLLDSSAVRAAQSQEKSINEVLFELIMLGLDGYKFSMTYNKEREKWQASLYGAETDCPNAGMMLSIEHSEPEKAARMLHVQHFIVHEGHWSARISGDAW